MQIQINTDHNIEGREKLADHVSGVVVSALNHFADRITRVEVHLSDQNSDKRGQDDKRCLMEARLEGHQPPPSRTMRQPSTKLSTAPPTSW